MNARLVLIAGALVGLIPWALGVIPGTEADRMQRLIWGYGLAAAPFLVVWRGWRTLPDSRRGFWRLIAVALGVRLLLLTLPPLLSEDVWRYVWDGAQQWAGINPFQHPPNSTAVDAVASTPQLAAVRAAIGHAHIPTIYPPAAQLAFAGAGAIAPSPFWLRLLFAGCDVVAVAALWRWARTTERPPQLAALYAFAPPVMLEGAVGGHLDAMGVAAMVVAGAAIARGRWLRAGLALGWSIGTKLLPLIVLPTLLLRREWRVAVVAVGLVVGITLPYVDVGEDGLSGLKTYAADWRANDGAFAVMMAGYERVWPPSRHDVPLSPEGVRFVRALAGPPPHGDATKVWPDEVAFAAAKATSIALLAIVGLITLLRARSYDALLGPCIAALLLLAPVVHPWYLLWAWPFVALAAPDRRWPRAFLLWGCLVWLAYLPRPEYVRTGRWVASSWAVWVQYLPVWIMLVLGAIRGVQRPQAS